MSARHQTIWRVLLYLLSMCVPACAFSQQKCALPSALSAPAGANLFSPEREQELGDLMAEQTENRYQVIRDTELTAYMERVANRLLPQLPPTGFRIQIFLIDAPVVDAFSTAGGRIYVSRKMVAIARNEDELAGLLGHEMGHIVTRQPSIEMSLLFRQVLGVTQLDSRQDLATRYNQLLDNASRGTPAYQKLAHEEEPDQYVADQVALYAIANAGYSPRSFLDFFDRVALTHGKTGGFFSNWFGLTSPNEKRLSQMQKALAAMPPGCGPGSASAASADFQSWQAAVIGYSRVSPPEHLPGLLTKQSLNPAFRDDITQVRFSPDGEYALAQDESSIFVLSRRPFQFVFRIDAEDAYPASFTPDSKEIVFSTPGLRVEDWNLAAQKRVSVHELTLREGCEQSRLSPDGKTLACLVKRSSDAATATFFVPSFDLQILDVATEDAVFAKKHFLGGDFGSPSLLYILLSELLQSDLANFTFSPDSHYLLVTARGETMVVDLAAKSQVPLRGALKGMLKGNFAFLSSDRMIVENTQSPEKSAVLTFPAGETVNTLALGNPDLAASAQGTYALLRPVKDAMVGVMDVKTGKPVLALKQSSVIDIYDETFISQATSGEVGLFDLKVGSFGAKASLPVGPLGSLRVRNVSPDLRWLAVSGDTRGAVWDLSEMKRLYFTRGFRGAFFDGSGGLFADFPKKGDTPRAIVRADLSSIKLTSAHTFADDSHERQYGPYLVERRPNGKEKSSSWNATLQVSDVRDGKKLWEANFPKLVPDISVVSAENCMIFEWNLEDSSNRDSVKDEVKKYGGLGQLMKTIKGSTGMHLFEVLEAGTGTYRGAVIVDTGKNSFQIENRRASGDWLLITDSDDRTRLYSIATGELKGTVFGVRPVVSNTAGVLAVQNERGQLQFYKLPSLEKTAQLSFSGRISMNSFSADGTRFFVLADDQNAYNFDTSALQQSDRPMTTVPK